MTSSHQLKQGVSSESANTLPVIKLREDKTFTIPEKYRQARDLIITIPWMKERRRTDKHNWQVNIETWYRCKKLGEKPYLPEDHIEFKVAGGQPERYRIAWAETRRAPPTSKDVGIRTENSL